MQGPSSPSYLQMFATPRNLRLKPDAAHPDQMQWLGKTFAQNCIKHKQHPWNDKGAVLMTVWAENIDGVIRLRSSTSLRTGGYVEMVDVDTPTEDPMGRAVAVTQIAALALQHADKRGLAHMDWRIRYVFLSCS